MQMSLITKCYETIEKITFAESFKLDVSYGFNYKIKSQNQIVSLCCVLYGIP